VDIDGTARCRTGRTMHATLRLLARGELNRSAVIGVGRYLCSLSGVDIGLCEVVEQPILRSVFPHAQTLAGKHWHSTRQTLLDQDVVYNFHSELAGTRGASICM